MAVVITRKVNIDPIFLVDEAGKRVRTRAIALGVERAKFYVPVDTGLLKSSIRRTSFKSFGSDVFYSGYVETGTSRTRAQPYLAPAALDISRALPGIISDEFKGVI